MPCPRRPAADHELLSHFAQRNLPRMVILGGSGISFIPLPPSDTFACQVGKTELSPPETGEVQTILLPVVAPVH